MNVLNELSQEEQASHSQSSNTASLCIRISKQFGGILCLIIMLIDWIVYAEIIQSFHTGSYNHLFFIRYVAGSGFMLAIIPWYIASKRNTKTSKTASKTPLDVLEPIQAITINNDASSVAGASYKSLPNHSQSELVANEPIAEAHSQHLTIYRLLRYMSRGIIFVGTCSFLTGYTWYTSLDFTFVAANNTVYQSQCVWVLIISSLVLKTKITFMQVVAMLLAVGGVAMVSFGTTTESDKDVDPTWFGYVLCTASTISYSIQTISTKYYGDKYFRAHSQLADNFMLMFGMGLFIFLCFWPALIFLHFTGFERFSLPKTRNEIMTVVLPIGLDAIFTGSYMAGVTLGGPILMSLGALSVIPVSFMADVWLHGLEVTRLAVYGSILIFVSFVVIEIPIEKVCGCWVKRKK